MIDSNWRLSIREFARFAGVKQSTLRFYDEIGLLSPAGRGEDNHYRYYEPFQRMTLNFINLLVDLGVPLAEIKKMTDDRTPEKVIELLSRQGAILDRKLHELYTAYSIIHIFSKNIQTGLTVGDGTVRIEELEDSRYILGDVNDFTKSESFYKPYMDFYQASDENRINLRYPIGGYYNDINAFAADSRKPDRFFSMDPLGNCVRKAGKYIVGYLRGYYGEFGNMPEKIAAHAKEHDLICTGPVYTYYLLDEISISDRDQFLARIAVNVTKKKARYVGR